MIKVPTHIVNSSVSVLILIPDFIAPLVSLTLVPGRAGDI